jgi:putative transposase
VPAGAPRTTDPREVVNAILYRLHDGCAWRALPHDLPPEGTVRDYFHRWRRGGLGARINDALRRRVRQAEGRHAEPSAGILDGQSAKGTRTSARHWLRQPNVRSTTHRRGSSTQPFAVSLRFTTPSTQPPTRNAHASNFPA